MNEEDKAIYTEMQNIFLNAMLTWKSQNSNKVLSFEGKPQNLIDKNILNNFLHIIIDAFQITNETELNLSILECLETNVPTDRFIIAVSSPSSDGTEGFWGTAEAIIESAYWTTTESNIYIKAGIAINNVQYDYYRTNGTYRTVRETINIMNPAPVK